MKEKRIKDSNIKQELFKKYREEREHHQLLRDLRRSKELREGLIEMERTKQRDLQRRQMIEAEK